MSSKKKTTVAKEEATPALVPKLRFPEFREAKAWEEKSLGNEGELYSSLTGKAGADFDAGEARFVTYMNVFSNTFVDPKALRFVDVKEGENQNAVASGDVFFTISSETPDEVGMSSVLLEDLENCYLNSFCALFRFAESKRPNPIFTGYLLRQPLVRAYFTKKAQGSTRYNLSKDAFRSLPLCVPSPAEQQKIAECLSSVDELMAAQTRKLDSLKTHKKGLMQQLFPREGETQPRLRFPEFQDEWIAQNLEELSESISSGKDKAAPDGAFDLYGSTGIIGKTNNRSYSGIYLLAARVGANAGLLTKATGEFGVTDNTLVIVLKARQNIDFVFYYLDQIGLNKMIFGSGQPLITGGQLKALSIALPTEGEQQRIASCLSSLDALITAETQKLEALKTHKKAMMQQLFPSPEEVQA